MTTLKLTGIDGLLSVIGQKLGPTDWRVISQGDIDGFAAVSGDDYWIHVDPERAQNESPFGTTIAHGNLTLSLVDSFRYELMDLDGVALAVNYGWNKARFPTPVPSGARVRGYAELTSLGEIGDSWWQPVTKFTIELEDSEKPCFVGESVTRVRALD